MNTTKHPLFHHLFLLALMGIMLIPVVATALYAFSAEWSRSILPSEWTLHWFETIWLDPHFLAAATRSLLLCLFTALLGITVIFPVALVVHTSHPQWRKWMNPILVLPFTLPPVVASVGVLQLYAAWLGSPTSTFLVISGCYFTIILPFVYRALDNNLAAIGVQEISQAAALLGANHWATTRYILLPCLKNGLIVAFFLSLAFLMGEFVFINILSGGQFDTIQIYLYSLKNSSGHLSSTVVFSYFMLMLAITLLIHYFSKGNPS